MSRQPDEQLLFVYGTLRREHRHEFHRLLACHAVFVGEGVLRGRLFMVDYFPGAVPSDDSGDMVRGEVYRLESPASVLEPLDEHEECDPQRPERGLFRRDRFEVMLDSGKSVTAWVYVYNRSTDGLTEIPAGDFLKAVRRQRGSCDK